MSYVLHLGDCLTVMSAMQPDSVDAIVTDPPYGLTEPRSGGNGTGQMWATRTDETKAKRRGGFMGKEWDHAVPGVPFWEAALRVAKPGAHLLAFGGDRTHHRLMVAIEDAGWEIRTCIYWLTGQGFPKSLNVGKAIRKQFSADALCACDQHSTQTVQGSQDDCPEYFHSHDEQLPVDQGSDPNDFPLPGDVHEHSHVGRNGDDQASTQANTYPGVANGHLSNDDSSLSFGHRLTGFQDDGNVLSDMSLNTSPVSQTEKHSKVSRKSHKQNLVSDSASSSLSTPNNVTHSHLPHCTTCGKPIASAYDSYGTALKPAAEIIVMARKPLSEANIAANVLRWGTGALNIGASRISTQQVDDYGRSTTKADGNLSLSRAPGYGLAEKPYTPSAQGRWPANLALDEDAAELLDAQSGELGNAWRPNRDRDKRVTPGMFGGDKLGATYPDSGGASRFFYTSKASKRDRDEGLEGMPLKDASVGDRRPSGSMSQRIHADEGRPDTKARNFHPTVKPTDLMRWLVRLVTPPGGTVLDPFMGSGSTGKAAMLEGFSFVGIDIEQEYLDIADKRIAHAIATYEQQQEMAALQPQLWETTP